MYTDGTYNLTTKFIPIVGRYTHLSIILCASSQLFKMILEVDLSGEIEVRYTPSPWNASPLELWKNTAKLFRHYW